MPESAVTRHREALVVRLGNEAVRWDEDSLAQHSRDTWCLSVLRSLRGTLTARPLCVVSPTTVEEISETLQYANQHGLAVVPFGGGSGVCGGVLPPDGAIVIDLRRMNRILELNETALTVRVQAGMMGNAFEAALNERRLHDAQLPAVDRPVDRRRLGVDARRRPVLDALRQHRGHAAGARGRVAGRPRACARGSGRARPPGRTCATSFSAPRARSASSPKRPCASGRCRSTAADRGSGSRRCTTAWRPSASSCAPAGARRWCVCTTASRPRACSPT